MNGNGNNIGGSEIKKSVAQADGARAAHEITVRGRRCMNISGVSELISFDEGSVTAATVCGELTVDGSELHIGAFDTERGILSLDGNICGIFYDDEPKESAPRKRRLFGR